MRRRDSAVSPHDVAIGVAVVVGNEVAVAEEVHEAVPNPIHLQQQQQQQEQHPKAAAKHWTHEKSEWGTTAWSRPVSVSSTRPVSASVARPLSVKSHDSVSVSRSSSVLSGGGLWSLEGFFDIIGGGGSGNHNRRRSSLLAQQLLRRRLRLRLQWPRSLKRTVSTVDAACWRVERIGLG